MEDPYKEASRRALEKANFKKHLASYMVMGAFFIILNLLTSPMRMWWYWPMLGWGIGLAMHYFKAYGLFGHGEMSEEAIDRELKRMGRMDSGQHQRQLGEGSQTRWLSDDASVTASSPRKPTQWEDKDLV